jgi:chaperone BCS1
MTSLTTLLSHNTFLTGGFVLGLVGAMVAALRDVPKNIWEFIKRQFMLSAEVRSEDKIYEWFKFWLDKQPYMGKARFISASTHYDWINEKWVYTTVFTPAPGTHFMRYRGRLIWLQRTVEEQKGFSRPESMKIKCLGRDQSILKSLFADVQAISLNRNDNRIGVYAPCDTDWRELQRKRRRPLDSVILPGTIAIDILSDIQRFDSEEELYARRGTPYRRGYLLEGPPGSGKSSLVFALASALGKDIYTLNLSLKGMDDSTVINLMTRVPPNALLLIEDIDKAFVERDKSDDASQITFSGLLNAIDGVGSKDGQLLFMSTNHVEKLDPALIRPGRADVHYHIGLPTEDQVAKLFSLFFPGSSLAPQFASVAVAKDMSMAAIQGHLLNHRTDESAVNNL